MHPPSREIHTATEDSDMAKDVFEETESVEKSTSDFLRVLHVSKTFKGSDTKAVDDVSFGVAKDTVFAMLGPNGAGAHIPLTMTICNDTFDLIILRKDVYVQHYPWRHLPRFGRRLYQ